MLSSDEKLPSLVHIVLPGLGCQSILSSHDVGDGEGAGVTRGDNGDKLGEGVGCKKLQREMTLDVNNTIKGRRTQDHI
jgi:hypothetical protein